MVSYLKDYISNANSEFAHRFTAPGGKFYKLLSVVATVTVASPGLGLAMVPYKVNNKFNSVNVTEVPSLFVIDGGLGSIQIILHGYITKSFSFVITEGVAPSPQAGSITVFYELVDTPENDESIASLLI